jgi:hypothetical protein
VARYNRGLLRNVLGDKAGAREDLTEALRLLPPDDPGRATGEWILESLGDE